MKGDTFQKITRLTVAIVIVAVAFIVWDSHTPSEIEWESASVEGHDVIRAPDLVIQHQTASEVWATIGYSVYRSRRGDSFEKVITITPRFGLAWGGYLRVLRSLTDHVELTEVLPLSPDLLLVFAGGDIYRVNIETKSQEHVHRMRYFGLGRGRGVMPHGIAVDDEGSIYYGEYPTRISDSADTVRLYRSDDEGRTWEIAFEFEPGQVRHIHTVRSDPINHGLWVGTGDLDQESHIGYSYDRGATFEWIGGGSQLYRVVSILFFDDAVAWGTDTDEVTNMRTVLWHRSESRIDIGAQALPAPTYYALELSDKAGIITVADTDMSVWFLDSRNNSRRIFGWAANPENSGPIPVIRLPRSTNLGSEWIYLSPLRTIERDAAVYRFPTSLLVRTGTNETN